MQKWTLEEGLQLVRAIQQDSRKFGYHVTMGGGVLNTGSSEKDIDVYFLPMDNGKDKANPDGVVSWLIEMWGQAEAIGEYGREAEIEGAMYRHRQRYGIPEPPKFKFAEDLLKGVQIDPQWVAYINKPAENKASPYKYKLRFTRPGDDQIDVFIMG